MLDDCSQRGSARLYYPACSMVGIDQVNTQIDKMLRHGAFTAADTASESENPGCCRQGSRSGYSIRSAIVEQGR
jgi:hypothetical protein